VTANNGMQRSGHHKVHAPHGLELFSRSDGAPKALRAVADAGR
jgi:hypothetical protein